MRTVRPATVADAPAISALIIGVSRFFIPEPGGGEAEAFLKSVTPEAIAGYIRDPRYLYITAVTVRFRRERPAHRSCRNRLHPDVQKNLTAPIKRRFGSGRIRTRQMRHRPQASNVCNSRG